ncbi:peptidoglycan-binding protein [Lysobacter sp. CA199]|uniref:peptidoglycan-binding protein n=1 Tax=Lysobacter sp. CA199 TaxID=3455608 RepID=UPI003F8D2E63
MEEEKKKKKYVLHLGEDGLPMDDVSHYTATAEHLRSYDRAADELYKFKVPTLLNTKDPHSYLLFGLMDGTQNDVGQDPLYATNVARFREQAFDLKRSGLQIEVLYEAGPATQTDPIKQKIDAARGYTSESIAERLYERIVEQTNKIYRQDPDAKVTVHAEGFSRGGSQVPILTRMIHDRGIPNLDRPEYVPDGRGNLTKTYPHFHQAPGHTPMSVGIYDPVPTGAMEYLDRRLAPSVVSGFQINAADERRGKFPVDRIIPAGLSEDGRFLSVSVAGAHSDIGGSYLRNGLGTRSYNLMTDYHDALFSESLLRRLPETYDPRLNVIHRSEEAFPFQYLPKTQRDLPAGEVIKLMPDDGSPVPTDPVTAAARHRPHPMTTAAQITEIASCTRDAARCVPTQMTAPLAEDSMAAKRNGLMGEVDIEIRPYEPPRPLSPGAKVLAAAGVAGIAASVVDAKASADRASTLLSQDNLSAAQSELTHYAARGTGGWIGGASAGLVATAVGTGPGVVGFIVVGGAAVAGAHVGEHVAKVLDSYKTFKHTDLQGVEWQSNGRQWVRQALGDLIDDGQNKPVKQEFSADPEKADELNYRASNVATELAIGKLDPPRNPYSQPAAENEPTSLRRADWERNPQTGAWDRKVVVGFEQPGVPMLRIDHASPERAAELDQASQQTIRENLANGPAPMAARYQMVHQSEGWRRFGEVPPSIQSALRDDSLVASDGKLYQRTGDGQWQRNGESVVAAGNLRQELESTRAVLQPQLAQHKQQVAEIPDRQPPTLEDIERKDLLSTYAAYGVQATPEQMKATLEAVRRTQHEYGVDPLKTSLHLGLNAKGERDVDSPIEHISHDADRVNRNTVVTSSLEVQMAMLDLRSPPPTTPESPELRIANLSPQQHAALEQVVREANRLGLQRDDVQATALQAVRGTADREPEIVVGAIDADQLPKQPKPVVREPEAPSPAPVKAVAAELAVEQPQTPQPEQKQAGDAQASAEQLDAARRTDTVAVAPIPAAPVTHSTAPPVRDAENQRPVVEAQVSTPKPSAPPPIAAPAIEPKKPEVLASTQPSHEAATPQPAPDAPTPTPSQPAPPVAPPVAADAAPSPDDGTLRRGDRGDDVEMLQYRLQRVGYAGPDETPLQRTGHFDAPTEHAVRQLQRDHGLPETGSVDPDTVQALAVAQQAKIESQKAEKVAIETPAVERAAKPAEMAAAINDERTVEPAATSLASSPPNARPIETSRQVEPSTAPSDEQSKEREPNYAPVRDQATPAPAMDAKDLARMSPADQAMFAKIRAGAPGHVSDETVAAAMLAAKQNEIHDAGSIKLVAAANGKLWVEAHTPGFHTGVSLSEPPPAMQDTLRETQAVNQQREQQLAQEASQRNPDDPSRGPSR